MCRGRCAQDLSRWECASRWSCHGHGPEAAGIQRKGSPQLPLGPHMSDQPPLDDDRAVHVQNALHDELAHEGHWSAHEPRAHRNRLHHAWVEYEAEAVLVLSSYLPQGKGRR